jgi:hypothetical protein
MSKNEMFILVTVLLLAAKPAKGKAEIISINKIYHFLVN